MILKARPENGSSSEGARVSSFSSSFTSQPFMSGRSVGAGR